MAFQVLLLSGQEAFPQGNKLLILAKMEEATGARLTLLPETVKKYSNCVLAKAQ